MTGRESGLEAVVIQVKRDLNSKLLVHWGEKRMKMEKKKSLSILGANCIELQ